jgi:hypothetical protein
LGGAERESEHLQPSSDFSTGTSEYDALALDLFWAGTIGEYRENTSKKKGVSKIIQKRSAPTLVA